MLQAVTSVLTKHKTKDKPVRKDKEREKNPPATPYPFFGGNLAVASPVHLLSLSFTPK